MTSFEILDEEKLKIYEIAFKMKQKGLSAKFITACVDQALQYEGTHDLMLLWIEAKNTNDRNEVLADLQDEIDLKHERSSKVQRKHFIKFDDLDLISGDVIRFKKALRKAIDKYGGLSKLSLNTGIPQPSLSRFFSTASIPRRTTLYKIAEALNLNEKEILSDWLG